MLLDLLRRREQRPNTEDLSGSERPQPRSGSPCAEQSFPAPDSSPMGGTHARPLRGSREGGPSHGDHADATTGQKCRRRALPLGLGSNRTKSRVRSRTPRPQEGSEPSAPDPRPDTSRRWWQRTGAPAACWAWAGSHDPARRAQKLRQRPGPAQPGPVPLRGRRRPALPQLPRPARGTAAAPPRLPKPHAHLPENLFPRRRAHRSVQRVAPRARRLGHLLSAGVAARKPRPGARRTLGVVVSGRSPRPSAGRSGRCRPTGRPRTETDWGHPEDAGPEWHL